jgi:hypothetical protein
MLFTPRENSYTTAEQGAATAQQTGLDERAEATLMADSAAQIKRGQELEPNPEIRRTPLVGDLLVTADHSDLLSEHWPSAKRGISDSQFIAYSIMSRCAKYRRRFNGKQLAEVQAEFAKYDDPDVFLLNTQVWERCAEIYTAWDEYEGWREMLDRAASNGQPIAQVIKGGRLLSNSDTFEEGIRMIENGLRSGDPYAVGAMSAVLGWSFADPTMSASWFLAACKLGARCEIPVTGCEYGRCKFTQTGEEALRQELGDTGYYIADRQSEKIIEAITSQRVDRLDVASDFQGSRFDGVQR